MGYLHLAGPGIRADELSYLLSEAGSVVRSVRQAGDTTVFSLVDPSPKSVELAVDLIATGFLRSAAVTVEDLAERSLWVASEWAGCLVVEPGEEAVAEGVASRLAPKPSESGPLLIFRVEPKAHGTRPGVRALEARNRSDVLDRPSDFYGEYADPSMGGATALFAAGMEMASFRGLPEDQVFVGAPEALGFRRDDGAHSIAAWRRQSIIDVAAVGFSLGSDHEVASLFESHGIAFDGRELARQADAWQRQGLRYGVGLVLVGLEDPPVHIPAGAVFQQPLIGSTSQNLAVALPASPMVAAGATVPLVLPAWCLNPTFSSPSGPVAATALVSEAPGGSQSAVWAGIRDRYEERP